MKRSALLFVFIVVLLAASAAWAQQGDLALSVLGAQDNTTTGEGVSETATKSGGVLISWRYFPHDHNGVEVNYSFTKNTHIYSTDSGVALTSVQSKMQEFSSAYVFHLTKGRFQPFALAGAGLLIFSPTDHAIKYADPYVSRQTRLALLYGGGVDTKINKDFAVRAQVRGFYYEAPDFFGAQYALHTSAPLRTLEPTVGVVWRF